jgi:hypothetical protein
LNETICIKTAPFSLTLSNPIQIEFHVVEAFSGAMAGEASCVFDGDSSGQETPVGFRDTPGQWYTANHRKRAALSQVAGEPTQRDSQATEAATEPVEEALGPVFVAATPSQERCSPRRERDRRGGDADPDDQLGGAGRYESVNVLRVMGRD